MNGITLKSWGRIMAAIAEARNKAWSKAKQAHSCVVDKYSITARVLTTRGTIKLKAAPLGETAERTKTGVFQLAAAVAAMHPKAKFVIVYDGWLDGTECLPKYAAGQFTPRVAEYSMEIFRKDD